MKKILYIHQYYRDPQDGGSHRSFFFAKKISEMGFEVTVISSTDDPDKVGIKYDNEDFKVYYLSYYSQKLTFYKRILYFTVFLLLAAKHSIFHKYDLIFATSTPLTVGIPALFAKLVRGTRYIFEVRDLWPSIPVELGFIKNTVIIRALYLLEKLCYKHADFIIFLSKDMEDDAINRFSKYCVETRVIENLALEADHFPKVSDTLPSQPVFKKDRISISYVGTFGYVNNMQYLVDLAKLVRDGNFPIDVYLVGDGAEFKKIYNECLTNKLANTVIHFIPKLDKRSALEFMRNSKFCISTVLPYDCLYKNSANKFFDSIAMGTPILINYRGWQEKIIVENDIGLKLSERPCIEDLAKICRIAEDDVRYQNMRKKANKVAMERYSLDIALHKLEYIFQNIS